jgi:hypothetical protein
MSDFWPAALDLDDLATPLGILEEAKSQWEANSGGVLSLFFRGAESKAGGDLILVYVRHVPSDRSRSLITVAHRKGDPYPLTIFFESEALPDHLKRSYTPIDFGVVAERVQGKEIENKWVCETPGEFRRKLAWALREGPVVADVQSLVAAAAEARVGVGDKAASEEVSDNTDNEPED